jgi:ABC-type phosphate/phosphonate transport system permease subunit
MDVRCTKRFDVRSNTERNHAASETIALMSRVIVIIVVSASDYFVTRQNHEKPKIRIYTRTIISLSRTMPSEGIAEN